MFDTHAHLNFKPYDSPEASQQAIDAAVQVGVDKILIPGVNLETSKSAIEIADKHEGLYAAVAVHPEDVSLEEEIDCDELARLAQSSSKVVAIGEIGLDRYSLERAGKDKDGPYFEAQKKAFLQQFRLALHVDKSVILHNRQAKKHMLELMQENWDSFYENRTVFHCCEPDKQILAFAQAHQIFIGVDGDITYNPQKASFIQKVPLEMLVLETDSPFLTPDPIRTESDRKAPNSPAYLPHIAQRVAEVKEIALEEVIHMTTENAVRLFRLQS